MALITDGYCLKCGMFRHLLKDGICKQCRKRYQDAQMAGGRICPVCSAELKNIGGTMWVCSGCSYYE